MRMSQWMPEIIRFSEDATSQTSYFKELASMIGQVLSTDDYICDAGCGIGQLAIELSAYVKKIDAVDHSQRAIDALSAKLKSQRTYNVAPKLADFRIHIPEERYDCMIFCLSLDVESAYKIAQDVCASKLIVINKVNESSPVKMAANARIRSSRGRPSHVASVEAIQKRLSKKRIPCNVKNIHLEFGQPFRDLIDAEYFFRIYRNKKYPDGISQEELNSILEFRENSPFPYYLPIERHLVIFEIECEPRSWFDATTSTRGIQGALV